MGRKIDTGDDSQEIASLTSSSISWNNCRLSIFHTSFNANLYRYNYLAHLFLYFNRVILFGLSNFERVCHRRGRGSVGVNASHRVTVEYLFAVFFCKTIFSGTHI